MNDCFRWKLLAGILAFLLAFATFNLTIMWTDQNYKNRAEQTYKDEICILTKIIGELRDINYYCYIPKVPTVANNIFMQPID